MSGIYNSYNLKPINSFDKTKVLYYKNIIFYTSIIELFHAKILNEVELPHLENSVSKDSSFVEKLPLCNLNFRSTNYLSLIVKLWYGKNYDNFLPTKE